MVIIIFLIGLIFGSFLNALVYRLHEKKSLWGRSECPYCHNQIKWYDNVPLLSFVILKGKCRNCQHRIFWQYPMVELAMGILFLVPTFFVSNQDLHGAFRILYQWLIIFDLSFIFLYDLKYQEIPDLATLPLTGLLFALGFLGGWDFAKDALMGAIIGSGFFFVQYVISKGRWIGGGDITLGFLMGVILGWQGTILALFLAYVLGAVISLFLLAFKKKGLKSEVPFGAFLTVATVVVMWWGNRMIGWYLGFLQ